MKQLIVLSDRDGHELRAMASREEQVRLRTALAGEGVRVRLQLVVPPATNGSRPTAG